MEERTALDMLEAVARRDLAIVEHRLDRFWAVSHMFGSYLMGPSELLGQIATLQRVDTPERLDRYVARLSGVPAYFEAIREVMRESVGAGMVAPGVVVDRSIGLVERLLEAGPDGSPLLEPVSDPDRERVLASLSELVLPALAGYLEGLRDYRTSARKTLGLGALPGGEEMYAAEILG